MRQVIHGKIYDTETAEMIGEDSFLGYTDFRYWKEQLYQTRKGNFFLYGEGGPLSCYAVREGNGRTSGEKIIPYTEDEAKAWVEEHLSASVYESMFEVEEA